MTQKQENDDYELLCLVSKKKCDWFVKNIESLLNDHFEKIKTLEKDWKHAYPIKGLEENWQYLLIFFSSSSKQSEKINSFVLPFLEQTKSNLKCLNRYQLINLTTEKKVNKNNYSDKNVLNKKLIKKQNRIEKENAE